MSLFGGNTRRGLLVLWFVVAAIVIGHAAWMAGYLARTSAIAFRDPPGVSDRAQLQQGFSLDGLMWLDHAIRLDEQNSWRVRFTQFDSPPAGREVHWNSGWAWWLRGLGQVRAWFTHEPLPTAIERAAVWANLPVLLFGMMTLCVWVARRWGAIAGCLTILGVGLHRDFYEAFQPGNPDHHGVITLCVLGMIMGLLVAGCGWWRSAEHAPRFSFLPRDESAAKRAAGLSAIWGGVGLWFSAASLVVPIALVGVAAVLASWWLAPRLRDEGVSFAAGIWRRWGRVGAGISLGFYLLEYFPHLPLRRFEINHPLYALAWWAGAEVVAVAIAWRANGRAGVSRREGVAATVAVVALAAVALTFLTMKESGFVFARPFMERLYRHVDELKPLWENIQRQGIWKHVDHAVIYLVPIALMPVWLVARRVSASAKLLGCVALVLAAGLTLQGWFQMRWLLIAGAAQIALVSVWVGLLISGPALQRNRWAATLAFVMGGGLYLAGPWLLAAEIVAVERLRDVRRDECLQLFYRDVAQRLTQENTGSRVVLLASPNASVSVAYYGSFKAVGTFYWENEAGLAQAARMWMARTDDEAAGLIREAGVTHVLVSWPHDFYAEYHDALRPEWALSETFSERVKAFRLPVWLRPLRYSPPVELKRLGLRGDLYAVDFGQTEAEAGLAQGRFLLGRGFTRAATGALSMAALAGDPDGAMDLAWILATSRDDLIRDKAKALRWAAFAAEKRPESVRARMVLAAAFAENGRFPEANGAIIFATELADEQGRRDLVAVLMRHAEAYRSGRAWRE